MKATKVFSSRWVLEFPIWNTLRWLLLPFCWYHIGYHRSSKRWWNGIVLQPLSYSAEAIHLVETNLDVSIYLWKVRRNYKLCLLQCAIVVLTLMVFKKVTQTASVLWKSLICQHWFSVVVVTRCETLQELGHMKLELWLDRNWPQVKNLVDDLDVCEWDWWCLLRL